MEKIDDIEKIADTLKEIMEQEKALIVRLVTATKGNLAGKWQDGSWRDYNLKTKIKGYHVLINASHEVIKSQWAPTKEKDVVYLALWKSTMTGTYKGKKQFKNEEITEGWETARNYISIEDLVTTVLDELKKKLHDSEKTDLAKLDNMITEAGV